MAIGLKSSSKVGQFYKILEVRVLFVKFTSYMHEKKQTLFHTFQNTLIINKYLRDVLAGNICVI